MKIAETALPGVLLLTPQQFTDDRGIFWESWNAERMQSLGLPSRWVQDNMSISRSNVVRGIHYQLVQPQGKLVRVTHGAALDVAVDLRRSSPAFGQHVAVELSGRTGQMLWIPEGFGHAFLALTDEVGFAYKVTDYYAPQGERTIAWDDPDLAIPWPVSPDQAVVSRKDRSGLRLAQAEVFP